MADRRGVPRSLAEPGRPADLRFGAKAAIALAALCLAGPVVLLALWLALTGGRGAILDLPVLATLLVILEIVAFVVGGIPALVLGILAVVRGEEGVPRLGRIALAILAVAVVLLLVQLAFWGE